MTSLSIRKTISERKLSIKTQTLATLTAIFAAVVIPQFFHVLGAVSGLGTSMGETFLPMHLPIILVGLLAGPYAGFFSGTFGPLASYALSGMPGIAMLPFMMIELAFYGFTAGVLRNVKMYTFVKVLISQVVGRLMRAVAIVFAVSYLGNTSIHTVIIWNSIVKGLPGLLLQWSLLPLIVFWIEKGKKNEQ